MDHVGLPASIEISALLYGLRVSFFKNDFPGFLSKDMLCVLKRDNSLKSIKKLFSHFLR